MQGKQLLSILGAIAVFAVSAIIAVALSMWYTGKEGGSAEMPDAVSLPSTPGTPPDELLSAAAAAVDAGAVTEEPIEVEFTDAEE